MERKKREHSISYKTHNSAFYGILLLFVGVIMGYVLSTSGTITGSVVSPPPSCGNMVCDACEEYICPEDCTYCGDGNCDPNEDASMCAMDCGYCGDTFCSPELGEDNWNCPQDCA